MAERFHFNPETGRTGKCGSDPSNPRARGCRFGQSDAQHGATREEAKANYETKMAPELFANTQARTQPVERARYIDIGSNEYVSQLRYDGKVYKTKGADGKDRYIRAIKNPLGTPIVSSITWDKEVTGSADAYIAVEVKDPLDPSLTGQRSIIEGSEMEARYSSISREDVAAALKKVQADREAATPRNEVPEGGYKRFSHRELDGEDWELQDETRYSAADLIRLRQIDSAAIDLAEKEDGGWVTVKVPSASEVSISVELARRELEKVEDENRNRLRRFF